ncbi:MAG: lipoyl(octanoyl) transferase LipB [Gemmatimonadota bacterium]|nr:lipoyl(octanoyl) transferase LipB [Gemmatimonadota bacterium]MDH5759264.1 lipoyl(octanoyl) transferase LipB [Gemmatimonadota bacterium]
MTGVSRSLAVRRLGRVSYSRGLELQDGLVRARRAGEIPDTLLLLEHPHVITLGTGSREEHLLADADERERRGIELFEVGRGGDVTYHGPGQLVGYPILDLNPDRRDLHRYLRDLEGMLIEVLRGYGVEGRRVDGLTGVWTPGGKVAAIGVRVASGWITSHGFALNVSTDLGYFDTIVPCGIADRDVTSLERETGREVASREVEDAVVRAFCATFGAAVVSDVTG